MIIICPKCKTKFRLHTEDTASNIGQCVQCCRCQTQWTIEDDSDIQKPAPQIPFVSTDLIQPNWVNEDPLQDQREQEIRQSHVPSQQSQVQRKKRSILEHIPRIHIHYSLKTIYIVGIFIFGMMSSFGISYYLIKNNTNSNKPKVMEHKELSEAVKIILSPLKLISEDGKEYILVDGQIVNQTSTLYTLPKFKISMLNSDEKIIDTKYRQPPVRLLDSERSETFSFKIKRTNAAIKKIKVSFEKGEQK